MFRVLVYIFLFYLLYRFVFDFLVPVFKTTQQVKKGFDEMHDRMTASAGDKTYSPTKKTQQANDAGKKPASDYIDFEEIK
jgi:hypothetical protein